MPIYSSEVLSFKEPTAAEVALTASLVSVIRSHNAKTREHLFHLCMIAYGLRKHNLMKKKSGAGGNASRLVMKPQFKAWYEANDLKEVYGSSETNFVLYAMAGRLLNYVRWQVGEQYIAHLPKSLTALYKCSQILWRNGDSTDDARRELFDDALKTPIRDGSKHNALITPLVTRGEIEVWLEKKAGISASASGIGSLSTPKPGKGNKNSSRNVELLTIKVHEDIFKFAKTGRKVGSLDLPVIQKLQSEVEALISKYDKGRAKIEIVSNLEDIKKTYEERKSPDFAKNIK